MGEQINQLTKSRSDALGRAMDSLIREHPGVQPVEELFLIITLYANGLTGSENEFCKQHLVRRHRESSELRVADRLRQWRVTRNEFPGRNELSKGSVKEGTMAKETVFGGRVVGINLPKVRGVVDVDSGLAVVSIEGRAECALGDVASIPFVDLIFRVPIKSAKDFFAGQSVEVIVRSKEDTGG